MEVQRDELEKEKREFSRAKDGPGRALVETDREAGAEVGGIGFPLERAAAGATVDAAAQESILPVELRPIRERQRQPRPAAHVLEPVRGPREPAYAASAPPPPHRRASDPPE